MSGDGVRTMNPAHEFERRAAKAHDHEGNLVGYYIDADAWREVRALITQSATRPTLRVSGGGMIGTMSDPYRHWPIPKRDETSEGEVR